MKIIRLFKIIVAAGLILSLAVSGACSSVKGRGRVELIYDNIVYKPYEHWIFSEKDGLAADGIRLSSFALDYDPDLAKGLSVLEQIKIRDGFAVLKKYAAGKNIDELYDCKIYNENLELIHPNGSIKDLPIGFDIMYIVFEVVWLDKSGQSGYEYIFKITDRR